MFIVGIVACIAAFKENKCLLAVVNVYYFFHIFSQQKYLCIWNPVKFNTSVSAMVLSDKCFIIHLLHVFPDRQITNCVKNVLRRHFLVLFQLFSFMLVILTALVTSGALGYAFRKDVSIRNFMQISVTLKWFIDNDFFIQAIWNLTVIWFCLNMTPSVKDLHFLTQYLKETITKMMIIHLYVL